MYKVIRMFQAPHRDSRVLRANLTLKQAQTHCQNPETSSSTCTTLDNKNYTRRYGPWFDGYEEQK